MIKRFKAHNKEAECLCYPMNSQKSTKNVLFINDTVGLLSTLLQ